jgi:UDP-N-acetylglucosamine 2-epimerase (non-hydrolysing)
MPEEINRIITDHSSDILFATSEVAMENLRSEGLSDRSYMTGDVMYESLIWARDQAKERSRIVADLGLSESEFHLATIHRPRNTDNPERLEKIIGALDTTDKDVIFPVHPRTRNALDKYGIREDSYNNIIMTEPTGYIDFVRLVDAAARVITDSGGVQKEAFFLKTPCVTLREETEWVETVKSGMNQLVGADPELIKDTLQQEVSLPENIPEPYGDGTATVKIRELLEAAVSESNDMDL